jgi:hypothetical protein
MRICLVVGVDEKPFGVGGSLCKVTVSRHRVCMQYASKGVDHLTAANVF